ncbi:hypothetical protein BV25DRAFT_1565135 [Artomyces pyxidatus]|uniref:Uncharacterized protein n=1 Tax=Artomyces pyxidatus TaxID=48021 RepID=A0ACB8SLB8_9AGAM|nr:hypothetical protein BV25DRAFT_1565135 [Artomyces pyxidatus]
MPPRRTRLRRAADAMSDNIEEDDASRREDEDAVVDEEEEEEEQVRRPKTRKGKAGKQRALEPLSDAGEDEVVPDNSEPVNEETFGNKPLDRNEGQKIQGMASDWNAMDGNLRAGAFTLLSEVASAVAEYGEGEETEKLHKLDVLMKEIVDIDVEILSHEKVLKQLHQQVVSGEQISDIVDRYEKNVQAELNSYENKTSRQKYAKHDKYASFKQSIYEVQHPDEAMPPVIEFIPKEDGDNSDDDDDDIQVGGVLQDLKCPITLTLLVNPLTAGPCGHSFSAEAITQMLGPNRATKKTCPAAGCNRMICLNDCKPDKDLERKVKAYDRRARRREDEMEAEEIIE